MGEFKSSNSKLVLSPVDRASVGVATVSAPVGVRDEERIGRGLDGVLLLSGALS